MKIAVLTSLFGSEHDLFPLANPYESADYYAFVDRDHPNAEGWRLINSPDFSICDSVYYNRRNAKIYKVAPSLFLPDYDYYIWMDACNCLSIDPKELIEGYVGESDLGLFAHPHRNCLYEEAQVIYQYELDLPEIVQDQMNAYKMSRFPSNYGLYELSCFIMKNNETTRKMGLMWWEQICRFSSRDQISFPFVLAQVQEELNISILPGYVHHEDGNKLFLFLDKHGQPTEWANRASLVKRQNL